MGIDAAFFDRLLQIEAEQGIFRGSSVAILGDCRFLTKWATGDNRADLAQFRERLNMGRVETLDIGGAPTVRIDLHQPLPAELAGKFDVVIDAGTVHCCFDVAAVMKNCLELMKERASIIHMSALTGYFGRCYYKIDPLLFKDFYLQNGFEPVACEYRITMTEYFMARLQRKFLKWLGRESGGFCKIPLGGLYLQHADFVRMKFGADVEGAAHMIPNDAVIIFFARRERAAQFIRPVPSFFMGTNTTSEESNS